MKKFELRVGNLIYNKQGNTMYVNPNHLIMLVYGIEDLFKPIPLTEKWLLEFGFIRHHDDYANSVIYIKNVLDNTEFEWGVYPFELGSGFVINNSQKLKYVHQLQNLYFALTNEELVVKE